MDYRLGNTLARTREWEPLQPPAALGSGVASPGLVDSYEGVLCTVTTELPPEYEEVYHHEYPLASTYVGKAEECLVDISVPLPDQLFPSAWVVSRIADTFSDKVEDQGAHMLDLKIYEDLSPTWETNYRVVATSTASPVPWFIIIPLVLAVVLVVAFIFLIREVKTIDWGQPLGVALPILAVALGIAAAAGLAIALTRKKKLPRGGDY